MDTTDLLTERRRFVYSNNGMLHHPECRYAVGEAVYLTATETGMLGRARVAQCSKCWRYGRMEPVRVLKWVDGGGV